MGDIRYSKQVELRVARGMKERGYVYVVFFETYDPLFFKSSLEVGPFMRSYPELKMSKTMTVDQWIEQLETWEVEA